MEKDEVVQNEYSWGWNVVFFTRNLTTKYTKYTKTRDKGVERKDAKAQRRKVDEKV